MLTSFSFCSCWKRCHFDKILVLVHIRNDVTLIISSLNTFPKRHQVIILQFSSIIKTTSGHRAFVLFLFRDLITWTAIVIPQARSDQGKVLQYPIFWSPKYTKCFVGGYRRLVYITVACAGAWYHCRFGSCEQFSFWPSTVWGLICDICRCFVAWIAWN